MPAVLRSLWDEPRPPGAPRRVWRDWALVGVIVPVAVLEGVLRPDLPWRAVSVCVAVGLVPTLLWRRSRPLAMVVICFAVTGLPGVLTGEPLSEMYTMVYQLILPYALFRWGSGREAVTGLVIMIVSASLTTIGEDATGAGTIGAFAVLSTTVTLGGALRYRARARARELDQAKLLEREQLARDLHDTVAHHVSAMAIRAQAGLAGCGCWCPP
ncbi:histidine kinase dimerization/phosphoacceptor domain-containing protein [Streptosporangium sp. NPDC023615]|uniref:histidine kinase dimerization/phosphoacceptor domain-containing protein n=1 Tax=Streptosporangium sp. NPDC023615 TaxID=3154794 RepID=UPI0034173437